MNPNSPTIKKRVYAFNIDFFLIFLTNHFLLLAFKQFLGHLFFYFPFKLQMILATKIEPIIFLSMTILAFAYFTLFYFVTNGHTFGKSLMGLRVYNPDLSELTLKQSMLRAASYIICAYTGYFLFALPYIRKDQKSLADVLSHTFVNFEEKTIKNNNKPNNSQETLPQNNVIALKPIDSSNEASKIENSIEQKLKKDKAA